MPRQIGRLVRQIMVVFLVVTSGAWVLSRLPLASYGVFLNYHLNDLLTVSLPARATSDQVVALRMYRPEDGEFVLRRDLEGLKSSLKKVLEQNPKLVISAFKLPIAGVDEVKLRDFVAFAKSYPQLYFYSYYTDLDAESLARHPILKDLNHIFVPLTKDVGPPQDSRVRRLIVRMDLEQGEVENPLLGLLRTHHVPVDESMFRQSEVWVRYRRAEDMRAIPMARLGELDLNQRIVVVGKDFENEEPEYRAGSLHSIWSANSQGLSAAERIALDLQTFVNGDPIRHPSSEVRLALMTVVLFAYALGLWLLPSWWAFISGFLAIGVTVLISIVGYVYFSTFLNLGQLLLGLILAHIFAGSYLLVRALRRQDRLVAEQEKQLELQRVKAQVLVKSARADIGLRIATQVAHDIRSPLSGIRIAAQKAEADLAPEVRDLLMASVERLQVISDDLLKRFRQGDVYEQRSVRYVFLFEMLESLAESYRQSWQGLEIQVQGDRELCLELLDATDLERAFSNLFNNAVEAMAATNEPHRIEVVLNDLGHDMEVLVRDTGPGIDPKFAPYVFERGRSFGKSSGSGLGLAQVREAVEALGGRVELVTIGMGACFRLTFPKGPMGLSSLQVHRRAVVVEDNPQLRERWLTKLKAAGVEAMSASSPEEFGSLKLEQPYTLVTDLMFDNSEQTGFDVLEIVRRHRCQKILCSSLSGNAEIQRMAANVADHVVTKSRFEELRLTT